MLRHPTPTATNDSDKPRVHTASGAAAIHVYLSGMSRLRPFVRAELDDAQAEIWDRVTARPQVGPFTWVDEQGSLIGPLNAYLHAPDIGGRLAALGAHVRDRLSIEPRLCEVAVCTVGAHWQSEFEFWAHGAIAIRQGVDPAVLEALRDGRAPSFNRDDERVVHSITAQLLKDRRVDDETYAAGVDLLGDAGMVELVSLAGYYCLISMLLNLFDVGLPTGEKRAWGV